MAFTGMSSRASLATACCCAVCGIAACGDDGGSGPFAERPPRERPLAGETQLARAHRGTATRAFLDYYSALQFQAWPTAVSYYDRRLRRRADDDLLISALASQSELFRRGRPQIVRATGKRVVSIAYSVRGPSKGRRRVFRVTLRRDARDRWRLTYDAVLENVLRHLAG